MFKKFIKNLLIFFGGSPVYQNQQEKHRRKKQSGYGVNFGADAFSRHGINGDGKVLHAVAGGEKADDKIVQRKGKGEDGARNNAGH